MIELQKCPGVRMSKQKLHKDFLHRFIHVYECAPMAA